MNKAELREFARHSFEKGSWLRLYRDMEFQQRPESYQMIDISQGGVSFKVTSPEAFKRGDIFYIFQLGDKVFADMIRGQVKYVMSLDEHSFKVGVEFIEKVQKG